MAEEYHNETEEILELWKVFILGMTYPVHFKKYQKDLSMLNPEILNQEVMDKFKELFPQFENLWKNFTYIGFKEVASDTLFSKLFLEWTLEHPELQFGDKKKSESFQRLRQTVSYTHLTLPTIYSV